MLALHRLRYISRRSGCFLLRFDGRSSDRGHSAHLPVAHLSTLMRGALFTHSPPTTHSRSLRKKQIQLSLINLLLIFSYLYIHATLHLRQMNNDMLIIHYTSIPGNRGVKEGIAFSVALPLTKYPFPQSTASICCTTLVNELPAPKSKFFNVEEKYLSLGRTKHLSHLSRK